MKMSYRLGVVVACSVLGLLVLGWMGLHSLSSAMTEERRDQIDNLLKISVNIVQHYQTEESTGKMSHEQAQAAAIKALLGIQNEKGVYLTVLDSNNTVLVHFSPDRLGKRSLVSTATFTKALEVQGAYAFIEVNVAKPGAKAGETTPKLTGVTMFKPWGWLIQTGFFLDDIHDKYVGYAKSMLMVGLLLLAVTAGLTVYFARGIYRQLGGEPDYCAAMTREIARGHLGVTIQAAPEGSVLAALRNMQQALSQMISDVFAKAELIREASVDIESTMEQITKASAHSSEATSSTAAAVEEMVVSIGMIADNVRDTETHSEQATELTHEGQRQVNDATSKIKDIAVTIDEASGQVQGLAEQIGKIGGVAGVIREIAEQTNLLALNAAIEAARAGEQGRGFAVVAEEVGKLAKRTSLATADIAETIRAVQAETARVVTSMQTVTPQVIDGTTLAGQAEQSLQEINQAVVATLGKLHDIVNATSEQSTASNSIAANVERVATMLEESDKSVQGAHSSVTTLSSMVAEIHSDLARFNLKS